MDSKQDLIVKPSLIDLTNFCNNKGYEAEPHRIGKKFRCILLYKGKFVKFGYKLHTSWAECQRDVYYELYKIL